MRKRRFVPPGTSCDDEFIACAGGAVCQTVPALFPQDKELDSSSAIPEFSDCLKQLEWGDSCSPRRKFRELCREGLKFVDRTCVTSTSSQKNTFIPSTHARPSFQCDKFPCTPGLICGKDRYCRKRKQRREKFRELCDELGTFPRCRKGLV